MSLKIRLARFGKRNAPTYKVVVSETRDKRNGKFIDIIGNFNPLMTPPQINIDDEKLQSWKKNGANTTPAIEELISGTYKYVKYSPKKEKGSSEDTEAVVETTPEASEVTQEA